MIADHVRDAAATAAFPVASLVARSRSIAPSAVVGAATGVVLLAGALFSLAVAMR